MINISCITIICGDWSYFLDMIKSIDEEQIAELILISNKKDDDELVRQFESPKFNSIIKTYYGKNIGFTRAVNEAMEIASQPYFLWLSPDVIFIKPNTIKMVRDDLEKDEKAGIGSCIMYHDASNKVHYAGGVWNVDEDDLYKRWKQGEIEEGDRTLATQLKRDEIENVDLTKVIETRWITGAFFMIKKAMYDAIPKPDEKYFFFKSDGLYCLEAWQKGWKCILSPTKIIHLCGKSGYPWLKEGKNV